MSIMNRLRRAREERGVTVTEVAGRVGLSRPMVSHIEAGRRDPKLSDVERYAAAVGVNLQLEDHSDRPALSPDAQRVLDKFRAVVGSLEPHQLQIWEAELDILARHLR
jgi:transcriptional regulator with XRE-family HTH domain